MRIGCIGFGLLLASTSSVALAQQAPESPPQEGAGSGNPNGAAAAPSSQSSGTQLNDIVVTAQRRSERLQDVPLTVTSVSSDDLHAAGVTSLKGLQGIVSGFTFGGTGATSQPSIRGVSTGLSAAGSENPNALYVDGIYQGVQAVLNVELPDVDRIEVLKGPQGTLFGRNATGGAIEIFTRNPSFTPEMNLTLDTSYYTGSGTSRSSPRINAKAFVSGPIIPDLLAASLSGGYDWTKGYYKNDVTGEQTGIIRNANARGKLLFTPSDKLQVLLSGFYIKNTQDGQGYQVPYKGLTAASAYPGSVVSTEPYHVALDPGYGGLYLKQYGFSGKIELDSSIGTFTSLTGYTNTRGLITSTTSAARGTTPCLLNFACIDYYFPTRDREISQELNFASRSFGIFSFVAGLYYYDAEGRTGGSVQGSLAALDPEAFPLAVQDTAFHTRSYAAYGEATIKPTDRLSLIVGLRQNHEPHDDISYVPVSPLIKKTFNSTTPRVSVKYDVTNALKAYATFSMGYKSGLTGVTNTASTPQFAPVAPEKLYAYEGGLKYATSSLAINASFFYYDYKNKQEQTFTGTSYIIQNTGPVRIYGVDLDASSKVTRDLTLKGAFTWIPVAKYLDFPNAVGQSTDRIPFDPSMPPYNCAPGGGCGGFASLNFDATGHRLIRAPKVTASGTIAYNHNAFDASVTANYSSAVLHDITGFVRQSPYVNVNAEVGYSLPDGFRIGLFGRNLSNKAYILDAVTSASSFSVAVAPPRELGLSLSYSM